MRHKLQLLLRTFRVLQTHHCPWLRVPLRGAHEGLGREEVGSAVGPPVDSTVSPLTALRVHVERQL